MAVLCVMCMSSAYRHLLVSTPLRAACATTISRTYIRLCESLEWTGLQSLRWQGESVEVTLITTVCVNHLGVNEAHFKVVQHCRLVEVAKSSEIILRHQNIGIPQWWQVGGSRVYFVLHLLKKRKEASQQTNYVISAKMITVARDKRRLNTVHFEAI